MSEQKVWNYLVEKLGNKYGAAGLMGNLYAESGLIPNNLQNNYQRKLGFTDASYTEAVDSGAYTKFARDSAGYGLAQWTYWTRKRDLLAFAKKQGKSIGDLNMQLDFLFVELSKSFKAVLTTLKNAKTVREASDAVLLKFERPADMSENNQKRRAALGQAYYDKYAGSKTEDKQPQKVDKPVKVDSAKSFSRIYSRKYTVKPSDGLNMRSGAGTNKTIIATLKKGTKFRCYGYYTKQSDGTVWLYGVADGKIGFCSKKYLF